MSGEAAEREPAKGVWMLRHHDGPVCIHATREGAEEERSKFLNGVELTIEWWPLGP